MPLREGSYALMQEVKALVRPEFEANPDKYYPTDTFRKLGFSRSQCKCGHYFWRKSESVTTCGDSKYPLPPKSFLRPSILVSCSS